MGTKSIVALALLIVVGLVCVLCANNIVETNRAGQFQIKQAAVSGKMSARMTPGMYFQNFGTLTTMAKAFTFNFTSDKDDSGDTLSDESIEVRFNDGSICDISGSVRVIMPTTEDEAVALVEKFGYTSLDDLKEKLIKKAVRNALRSSANLMSARDSYSEKRLDYIQWTWDQIQNGLYQTEEKSEVMEDIVTGQKVTRNIKIIKRDDGGNPLRQEDNALHGTGITLSNFEIKGFGYEPKVEAQIAKQQEAIMNIETAKAEAQLAEQNAKTEEAKGKSLVMEAKYRKEQEKIQATVEADKEKEVAEIEASKKVAVAELAKEEAEIEAKKKVAVAELDKQAAELEKAATILRGEGEAESKKLIMAADGALQVKVNAWVEAQKAWAEAYKTRPVPGVVIGGSGSTDGETLDFSDALAVKLLNDLNVDMGLRRGNGDNFATQTVTPVQ